MAQAKESKNREKIVIPYNDLTTEQRIILLANLILDEVQADQKGLNILKSIKRGKNGQLSFDT